MSTPLRIIFMGTPHFAVPALASLIAGPHEVVAVYSQPPRPAGRGQKVQASPVQAYAEAQGIPVFTPKNFRDDDVRETFTSHKADVAVVAAYGLILPSYILTTPVHGCINIHASLLPRWRGASPIHHAIWRGDTETGITIMQMDRGLDTGPMLAKSAVPITATATTESLQDVLADLGAVMIGTVLDNITSLHPEDQNEALATYAPLLKKEHGEIRWADTANEIDHQIRALNPWPGTFTATRGKRLKILEATPVEESSEQAVGTVTNTDALMSCGKGTLQITRLQPDGGKPMDARAAFSGHYLHVGDVLS